MYLFYTASLNENIEQIVESARFGWQHTPYLKVKLDNDIEKTVKILSRLYEEFAKKKEDKWFSEAKWSIDANSAWDTNTYRKFFEEVTKGRLKLIKPLLYMVEQPFPLQFQLKCSAQELDEWKSISNCFIQEGIHVFGDESVSTSQTVS